MSTIRVLLADDHPLYRSGLRLLLEGQQDLVVVAEAATTAEVVEQVAGSHPDVIVMDVAMPGGDGIDATRQILRSSPHAGPMV